MNSHKSYRTGASAEQATRLARKVVQSGCTVQLFNPGCVVPAVQSRLCSPAVQSSCAAPAVQSSCAAPAVQSSCAAPAVQSRLCSPAVQSSCAAPLCGPGRLSDRLQWMDRSSVASALDFWRIGQHDKS